MNIPLPTYEQVLELPELLRTTVTEDLIDENNHVNVRHYFDLQIEGLDHLWRKFGIEEDYPESGEQAAFTLNHFLTYVAEVRLGEEIAVHGRLIERGDKTVHLMGLLVNRTTGVLSHVIEVLAASIDMSVRRIAPWPDFVQTAIDKVIAEQVVTWPAPVSGALKVRHS